MPAYVSLVRWTEQGIKNVRETVSRAEQVRGLAQRLGGQMNTMYWTQGAYDLVAITEFPDDESFAAFALTVGMMGTVRTESMRAFTADEIQRVLQKVP